MDNEPYRDLCHQEIVLTVAAWLRSQGFAVATEYRLPNERIADICAVTSEGAVHIVEVKTACTKTELEAAGVKYYPMANALWLASNRFAPPCFESNDLLSHWTPGPSVYGLIRVRPGNIEVMRHPCAHEIGERPHNMIRSALLPALIGG